MEAALAASDGSAAVAAALRATSAFELMGLALEAVDGSAVKRRYYKLALLLHPDKNSHPSAETAFKAPAGAIANTSTLVQLQTYPRARGLRADETERRRYRNAYARAGSDEPGLARAPRLERSA